jgi:hypothetical protein
VSTVRNHAFLSPMPILMESVSHVASSVQALEPFIMRIPTEILYHIFNYLVPHARLLIGHDDFSDILAVRATCRVFGAISSNLRFWYDEDFCFSQLIARRSNSPRKFDALKHETRVQGLFNCLAADQVLMEKMGRKRAWSFRTAPTLITAAQAIPSFQLHITSLYYESYVADLTSCPFPSIQLWFHIFGIMPKFDDPLDFG